MRKLFKSSGARNYFFSWQHAKDDFSHWDNSGVQERDFLFNTQWNKSRVISECLIILFQYRKKHMKKLYFRKAYADSYGAFIAYSRNGKYWNEKNSYDENSKADMNHKFLQGKFPFIMQEAFYKYIWKTYEDITL